MMSLDELKATFDKYNVYIEENKPDYKILDEINNSINLLGIINPNNHLINQNELMDGNAFVMHNDGVFCGQHVQLGDTMVYSIPHGWLRLGQLENHRNNYYFTYTQNTPTSIWDIHHNLNSNNVIIDIQNFENMHLLHELERVDSNRVIIRFTTPTNGIARLCI